MTNPKLREPYQASLHTLPGEHVEVLTVSGVDIHECESIQVPLGEDGAPAINRVQIDAYSNACVFITQTKTRIYNKDFWRSISVEDPPAKLIDRGAS